ncbi:hypothetical protein PAMP_010228 [Pampus punctatissimus]
MPVRASIQLLTDVEPILSGREGGRYLKTRAENYRGLSPLNNPGSRCLFTLTHAFPLCSEKTAPNSLCITRAFREAPIAAQPRLDWRDSCLAASAICDMNIFPRQNEEFTAAWKGPPCGARMTRSAVLLLPLLVGFRRGQLECNNEMEKFQRSEHLHAEGRPGCVPFNGSAAGLLNRLHRVTFSSGGENRFSQ